MGLVADYNSESSPIWLHLKFRMFRQQVVRYNEDPRKSPLYIRTLGDKLHCIVAWADCGARKPCHGFHSPLLTKCGGAYYEQWPFVKVVHCDHQGLDRLSKAHFISKQNAPTVLQREGHTFKLVRKQLLPLAALQLRQ
jgi:hypothetical protein